MRKNNCFFFLTLCFCIGCTQQNKRTDSNNKKNEVKLSIDTLVFDGKSAKDTSYLSFYVENIGVDTFRIVNSSASCECTSVIFDTGIIKSKEKKEIKLTYHHSGIKNPPLKNVVVETNTDPRFNILYLKEVHHK